MAIEKDVWQTHQWLYEHHINKKLSFKKIAKIVGVSDVRVSQVARELNIKPLSMIEMIGKDAPSKAINELYALGHTMCEISEKLNVTYGVVYKRITNKRPRNASRKIVISRGKMPYDEWANVKWLTDMYIINRLTIKQISKITKWSKTFIRNEIIKAGIKTRTASEAAKVNSGAISDRVREWWRDDSNRELMAKHFANMPKVSRLAEKLYAYLDELGIKYFREYNDKQDDAECIIGPYNFDCVIPRKGDRTLLIECQGYYHYSDKARSKDMSKATYISKYFNDQYELKEIWDHEFDCKDKVIESIKYWTKQYELELKQFEFSEIDIRVADKQEAIELLGKFHYLHGVGRGGACIGGYLDDKLIALAVFSPLVRQNIHQSLGYDKALHIKELSRLCIHPRYQKKNLASWFLSRAIKAYSKNDSKCMCIVSYSDTTYGHSGTVYKALGFAHDHTVSPDYWYISDSKWIMHKKSLYNHAVAHKMKESDYAKAYGYTKIYGKEKLRYILRIK